MSSAENQLPPPSSPIGNEDVESFLAPRGVDGLDTTAATPERMVPHQSATDASEGFEKQEPEPGMLRRASVGTPNYGTFRHQQRNRLRRSRQTTSDPEDSRYSWVKVQRETVSSPQTFANIEVDNEDDHDTSLPKHILTSSISLSSGEVEHLCDDASERIRYRPDSRHWLQVLGSSVLCPICGIGSAVYACKSRRYISSGEQDLAARMLRNSDFCMRLSAIFGTLLWFSVFIAVVVYKL